MSAIGGSVLALNLAGRNFSVAADSDAQTKRGGWENEQSPNGDGSARLIKTRVAWSVADVAVDTDNINGDPEFIQNLADQKGNFSVAITLTDGTVHNGTGQIVGEPVYSAAAGTTALGLAGPGKLTQQG